MQIKRIMVCLDGSKNSIKGLDTAITLAKQSSATIVGVHINTTFGLFTAVHGPKIKENKWSHEESGIIEEAKKRTTKNRLKFEGAVIAGRVAGYDLAAFANNPRNKIQHIVIGARGIGFPKEIFFGSTSTFVLHKARAPVTIVK